MDAIDMMLRYSARPEATGPDLSGWPVDVAEVVRTVCTLWHLQPPRTKQSKAYWIQASRELADACAEFAAYELLDVVHAQWVDDMRRNKARTGQGTASYIVEGPGSLVKVARAQAALFRRQAAEQAEDRARWLRCPYCGGAHTPQDHVD